MLTIVAVVLLPEDSKLEHRPYNVVFEGQEYKILVEKDKGRALVCVEK